MKIGGLILLLAITLGKTRQVTSSDDQASCNKNQYLSFNKCCSYCEPGNYAERECTESSDTVCRPCKEGTFTSKPNFAPKCRLCQPCGPVLSLSESCSPIKDNVCICPEGYYCNPSDRSNNRCQNCVLIAKSTTKSTAESTTIQTTRPFIQPGYPAWVTAILVISILLLAVLFGAVLYCCKKIIMRKFACRVKKPQAESIDTKAKIPPMVFKVAIPEEGRHLSFPIEETDASQSAVLLPNSFSSHSNSSTQ